MHLIVKHIRLLLVIIYSIWAHYSIALVYAETTSSQWTMILNRFRIAERWSVHFDLHPRFDLEDSKTHGDPDLRQLLVWPGMSYRLSDSWLAYIGYRLSESYNPRNTAHDFIQDLWHTKRTADWIFTQRIRAEELSVTSGNEVPHRWRFLSQVSIPIHSFDTISFVLNDELFFYLNSTSPSIQQGFTENRAFAGLAFSIPDNTTLQIGYQNQYREGRAGNIDRSNHILLAAFFFNFDLTS